MARRLALVVVAVIAIGAALVAMDSAFQRARLSESLVQTANAWRSRSGVTGVVVGISGPAGQQELAAGESDSATHASLTPTAQFRIGSITKTFVAATALQLVEEGRLRLDAPLADYGVGPSWVGPVTVRQLLANRSGIAEFENDAFFADAGARLDRRYAPIELIDRFSGGRLLFPPGSRFDYSNSNYVLAGLLIEKIAGASLESEIERRFIGPLQLRATGFRATATMAIGYSRTFAARLGQSVVDTRTVPGDAIESASWACGMMVSDAHDLATWIRSLYEGTVLRPETMAQLLAFDPAFGDYGLGTYRKSLPSGIAYGHGGIYFGYLAEAWYLPARDTAVVALANSDAGDLVGLIGDEASLALGAASVPPFDAAASDLNSSDAATRRNAALALGKADPDHGRQAVDLLVAALSRDPQPAVRAAAALALGLVGRFDPTRAADALQAAIDDNDRAVSDAARRALAALAAPPP